MLDPEAARRQTAEIAWTAGNVVYTTTGRALEVVMVGRLPNFVAAILAGERNDSNGTVGDQALEVAIHGRHAERSHASAPTVQDLLWRKRALGAPEHRLDRVALARGASNNLVSRFAHLVRRSLRLHDNDTSFSFCFLSAALCSADRELVAQESN
jgi:hypothetical protein